MTSTLLQPRLNALAMPVRPWRSVRVAFVPGFDVLFSLIRRWFRRPEADDVEARALVRAEALLAAARNEPRILRRDELRRDAVALVVHALTPAIRRYCAERLDHDAALADEATQRTFTTFWRVAGRFEGRSTLRTFVFGIALNTCREIRRSLRASPVLPAPDADALLDPTACTSMDADAEAAIEARERRAAVARAVARLSPRHRWILQHRIVDEVSYTDLLGPYRATFGDGIASEEGLRTLLFQARKALIKALGGCHDDETP